MRLPYVLTTVVAMLNLSCGLLPAQKGGDPSMTESPWELRLSVGEGVKLRAVLHNRTKRPQTYLYDVDLQPSTLILTAPSGERLQPFDTRSNAKFDNTVYREMYRQAAPGSEVTLDEASIASDHSLAWGPFLYANLAAGLYRAHVVWRSEKNEYYDPKSKRTNLLKDVWMGSVSSNTIDIHIR